MRTHARYVLGLLVVSILALGTALAQEIQRIGSPLVQQYTKSDYKAGNQNWAVATGKKYPPYELHV